MDLGPGSLLYIGDVNFGGGGERFRVETGRGSGGSGTDMGEFLESHWRY